ncbi:hypothetical protein [Flavobacterium sp. UBA4197]|uniref:hypothetical protein n=1 Tax=Flavobacterium sp. UBA4197 TaxID=1946546 RepID=UPI00257CEAC4|nr:hypothetical protein [Flavobacterium sp. UBA4197]
MFSISAIKGKFNRSKINFKDTYLYDEKPFSNIETLKQFQINEKCIIYYKKNNTYSWYLTNIRFIIPNEGRFVNLTDLKKVDFVNIKENPNLKMENKELTLLTRDEKFTFFVEENSWHLFYNIFKFIIEHNH